MRFIKNKIKLKDLGTAAIIVVLLFLTLLLKENLLPQEYDGRNIVTELFSPLPTPTPDSVLTENETLKTENGYMRQEIASRAKEFEASRSRQQKIINVINKNLGGKLANKGEYIYRASVANEVPAFLVVAIMKHETGSGIDKSSCLWSHNNVGGFFDGNHLKYYKTVEQSINEMCINVKRYYIDQGLTTIEKFGARYCPVGINDNGTNKYWVPAINRNYIKLLNELGTL